MSKERIVAWPRVLITTNAVSGQPHLEWQAVEGATGYEIYRATSRNGKYIRMWTVSRTSYTNTTAKPGVTYYYQVKALGTKEPQVSKVCYITCDCAQAEVEISTDVVSGKPTLTWEVVEGADKYEIYRSNNRDGKYTMQWMTSDTTYHNTTAQAGMTYYYMVKPLCATTHYGDGALSKKVYITCDCEMPVVSVASDAVSGKPTLTWDAVDGANRYEIYRSANEDGTYMRIWTTDNTRYSVPESNSGVTYYKVRALCEKSSYGDSAESQAVKTTIE